MLLGVIADDFTGATDIAGVLAKGGMRVCLTIDTPVAGMLADASDAYDAVVVALKTRSLPAVEAIAQSRAALKWLRGAGAERFYFKYCSTFDSTAAGNIGPVSDALLDDLQTPLTVICPAYPANARTVYQGHLLVGSQLLAESPMKDHPLTPMRDSDLLRLLAEQSGRKQILLPWGIVRQGAAVLGAALAEAASQHTSYAITDAIEDTDLETIAAACASLPLLTGGAGLAQALPAVYFTGGQLAHKTLPEPPKISGGVVILCGSCSEATQQQIAYAERHYPAYQLDIDAIADNTDAAVEAAVAWAHTQRERQKGEPLMIYGSATAEAVGAAQARYGRQEAGEMMERAIGGIACALVAMGARKIIVAGGETSGTVVSALNIRVLRVTAEIAPGVPWTESIGDDENDPPHLALALKSGNFGGKRFFSEALEMLP